MPFTPREACQLCACAALCSESRRFTFARLFIEFLPLRHDTPTPFPCPDVAYPPCLMPRAEPEQRCAICHDACASAFCCAAAQPSCTPEVESSAGKRAEVHGARRVEALPRHSDAQQQSSRVPRAQCSSRVVDAISSARCCSEVASIRARCRRAVQEGRGRGTAASTLQKRRCHAACGDGTCRKMQAETSRGARAA